MDLFDGEETLDGTGGRLKERSAGLSWLSRNLRVIRHCFITNFLGFLSGLSWVWDYGGFEE